jgi:hypothetical protein
MATDRPSITDENETVIEFHDKGPDKFGRRRFSAYWLADNIGPRCDEYGVRGQAFFADPGEFEADCLERGRTVRVVDVQPATEVAYARTSRPVTPAVVDVLLPVPEEAS